jgi:hypothetical protein
VRIRVRLDDGEELEAATTALDHLRPGERAAVRIDESGVAEVPWADADGTLET